MFIHSSLCRRILTVLSSYREVTLQLSPLFAVECSPSVDIGGAPHHKNINTGSKIDLHMTHIVKRCNNGHKTNHRMEPQRKRPPDKPLNGAARKETARQIIEWSPREGDRQTNHRMEPQGRRPPNKP